MDKVVMKVNGRQYQFVVGPDRVLLDLLRDDLRLTGAKQSCDRKGQCGACTVIVNGKAVRSCLQKVKNLNNAEVITIEGLGTPANPHLIKEAFVLAGAVQCGFCTPGMIMASKVLLDKNPAPDVPEIRKARLGMVMANQIKTGTVWVNQHLAIVFEIPWGGCKESGWSKENSTLALEVYTMQKHVWIDLAGTPQTPWQNLIRQCESDGKESVRT